jgi:hypothetical protein
MTVVYAAGIWLLFMGVTNIFDQLGQNGYISPEIAVWSPRYSFRNSRGVFTDEGKNVNIGWH